MEGRRPRPKVCHFGYLGFLLLIKQAIYLMHHDEAQSVKNVALHVKSRECRKYSVFTNNHVIIISLHLVF